MKTWHFMIVGACAALTSCATVPQAPIAATPVCSSSTQCQTEWDAARTFVIDHAGYKIQTYSRDFLQTYNSTDSSTDLAAIVNKAPDGPGRYKIVAAFSCDNPFGCFPDKWKTLDAFNRAVAAAGSQAAQ